MVLNPEQLRVSIVRASERDKWQPMVLDEMSEDILAERARPPGWQDAGALRFVGGQPAIPPSSYPRAMTALRQASTESCGQAAIRR